MFLEIEFQNLIISLTFAHQFSEEEYQRIEKCEDVKICLDNLKCDNQLAVAVSQLYLKTLPFQSNIFCFNSDKKFSKFPATFMIRRDFRFRKEFENVFKSIHAAGLIPKWEKDYRNKENRDSNENIVEPLTIDSFRSVFVILIGLLFAAVISRILEEIIFKASHEQHAHPFWKLADKLIDGERHFLLLDNQNYNS